MTIKSILNKIKDEYVSGVDLLGIKERWNRGERGYIGPELIRQVSRN